MTNTTLNDIKNCRAADPATCRYHGRLQHADAEQILAADRAEFMADYNERLLKEKFRARHHKDVTSVINDLYPGEPGHQHTGEVITALRPVLPNIKKTGNVSNDDVAMVTRDLFPNEALENHAVDVRAALQRVAVPYVDSPGFDVMNGLVKHALGEGDLPDGWSITRQKDEDDGKTRRIYLTVRNDSSGQYFTFTGTDAYGFRIRRVQANGNLRQVEKPAD